MLLKMLSVCVCNVSVLGVFDVVRCFCHFHRASQYIFTYIVFKYIFC